MKATTRRHRKQHRVRCNKCWLMKQVLRIKRKNTGKDLSHLKTEVPNVDMDEVNRKIDEKCREMMKKKSNDREEDR